MVGVREIGAADQGHHLSGLDVFPDHSFLVGAIAADVRQVVMHQLFGLILQVHVKGGDDLPAAALDGGGAIGLLQLLFGRQHEVRRLDTLVLRRLLVDLRQDVDFLGVVGLLFGYVALR